MSNVIKLVTEFPSTIWLCPKHFNLFWVPHDGTCPEPGCNREMVAFVPQSVGKREIDDIKCKDAR